MFLYDMLVIRNVIYTDRGGNKFMHCSLLKTEVYSPCIKVESIHSSKFIFPPSFNIYDHCLKPYDLKFTNSMIDNIVFLLIHHKKIKCKTVCLVTNCGLDLRRALGYYCMQVIPNRKYKCRSTVYPCR